MIDWCIFASFSFYLALMLAIGFACSKRMKNLGDYYLGGRKMNKWVVALSAQASDMSGWLLMGLPGAVYVSGLSAAWIGVGLAAGTYLNWKIVARRLRKYSQVCGDAITIPDFISNRFRDESGMSRLVAATIILVFFTFYTASGFVAAAKLFSSVFDISYAAALWAGAAVVVAYTLLGGYMAVCWTDFVQGLLMFFAIVIVPSLVVCEAGGLSAAVGRLESINPGLLGLFTDARTGVTCGWIALASCMVWGLGYFGMPHILVRFMSIGDPAEVKGARRIAMTWVFVSLCAAVALGLAFHLFLEQRALTLADVGNDPEKCFLVMIRTIFSGGYAARLFAGVLLSAILAAIMSTADSQLLVSASSFSNDIYKRLVRKNASDRELVAVSRLTVAAVAVVAALLSTNAGGDFFAVVMKMVSFAWGGFGASFGPLILLSLYWKRVNLAGAVAGMVTGATTCFVWKFVLAERFAQSYRIFSLYELAPAFALSAAVTVVVSLLTKKPSTEITNEFNVIQTA